MFLKTLGMLLLVGPSAQLLGQNRAVLEDVTVVNVQEGKLVTHQDIVIADGKISEVRNHKNIRKGHAPGAQKSYVIPGLWDMHTHLAGVAANGSWSGVLLPELLRFGVTSVRDMGSDLEIMKRWRREIASGERKGPDLYFSGPMLTTRQGSEPEQRTVRTAEDGVKAVDELKAQGADFIKILHIPRAAYFPLAEEAKKQHIDFVGHLPFGVTVQEAGAAGQKSIEHVNWSVLAIDCSGHPKQMREKLFAAFDSKEDGAYDRVLDEAAADFSEKSCGDVAAAMVKHGTWLVPTLVSEETAAHVLEQKLDERELALLPKKLQDDWSPEKLKADNSPGRVEWLQRQWKSDERIARFLHTHGVKMLAGSDSLDVMTFPGPTLHRELELLVEIGMTSAEALRAATLDAAAFLGKEKQTGTVEVGKSANLVVLSGDPLKEISNTRKIEAVYVRGQRVSVPAQ